MTDFIVLSDPCCLRLLTSRYKSKTGGCSVLRDKVNDARQMLHETLCEAGYDKVANESTPAGMRAQYLMVNFRR